MGDNTKIAWTEATWNPIVGCSRASPGCEHCYAERMAARLERMGQPQYQKLTRNGRWTGETRLVESALDAPLHWRKPRRVFVCSMGDLFHESVSNEEIATVFGVMAACPQHTFQVLTKRAERMRKWFEWFASKQWEGQQYKYGVMLSETRRMTTVNGAVAALNHAAYILSQTSHGAGLGLHYYEDRVKTYTFNAVVNGKDGWPLPNVWLGTTCEDQQRADERVSHLSATPAVVRFVSVEPMLEPINLRRGLARFCGCPQPSEPVPCDNWSNGKGCNSEPPRLDWVVVGGESGLGARKFDITWARDIRDQCKAARVPFFMKQLGANPVHGHTQRWTENGRQIEVHDEVEPEPGSIKSRAGSDPAEWPADLRVREYPETSHA